MAGGPIGGKGPNRVIEFAVDKHLIPADGVPAAVQPDIVPLYQSIDGLHLQSYGLQLPGSDKNL